MIVVGLFLAMVVFWHIECGVWVLIIFDGLFGLVVKGAGLVFARCVIVLAVLIKRELFD
jgi:hypothetical protein